MALTLTLSRRERELFFLYGVSSFSPQRGDFLAGEAPGGAWRIAQRTGPTAIRVIASTLWPTCQNATNLAIFSRVEPSPELCSYERLPTRSARPSSAKMHALHELG